MVILVDDEDRENEGDLTHGRREGDARGHQLHGQARPRPHLPDARPRRRPTRSSCRCSRRARAAARRSAPRSPSRSRRASGVTTGISAKDRAHTILTAVAPDARPEDLITPGHVFPLRAKRGGVLVRTGQTEGSVDLARLAGLSPAGVICEIMNDDGTMARMPDLEKFAAAARAAHPVDRRPDRVSAAAGVAGREARRRRR